MTDIPIVNVLVGKDTSKNRHHAAFHYDDLFNFAGNINGMP